MGYLYQVRLALLWSLRSLKEGALFSVSIETIDDVAFTRQDGATDEILQSKHHQNGAGSLGDSSPDIWKTLRIWIENRSNGIIDDDACLFLVTTCTAATDSAASKLRLTDREVDAATLLLEAVARTSTNVANKNAYKAFLNISAGERRKVLKQVRVLDGYAAIDDLYTLMSQEVYWAAGRDNTASFLERLEGWWFGQAIDHLVGSDMAQIVSSDIDSKMHDLREQFSTRSLPVDVALIEINLDEAVLAGYAGFMFVEQLELSAAGANRVSIAVRDYHRAFEQRSRWLREDLLNGIDLDHYDRELEEAWELVFESICDEIHADADDDEKTKNARKVLAWSEQYQRSIRPGVDAAFLTRGSLHLLADDIRIGWHKDFRERLQELVDSEVMPDE